MNSDSTIALGMIGAWAEQVEADFRARVESSGQEGVAFTLGDILVLAEALRRVQEGIILVINDEGGSLEEIEPFLPSEQVTDEDAPIDHLAMFMESNLRRGERDAAASAAGRTVN